jgi:acetylornithine deacetylase/succinyl-diaminopimelate desuccinylase-like protein
MPGFYDAVRPPAASQRQYLRGHGPADQELLEDAGVARGWGESEYSLFERTTLRPALTINGIEGGYRGPGSKGIIPARSKVKLSFRLVPDQEPRSVERLLRDYARNVLPSTVRFRIRTLSRARPVRMETAHPAFEAARRAYLAGFGREPIFLPSGGTIPVANVFKEILGLPTVLMGFALPDDRMHAPNERFRLTQFFKAIKTSAHFLKALAFVAPQRAKS